MYNIHLISEIIFFTYKNFFFKHYDHYDLRNHNKLYYQIFQFIVQNWIFQKFVQYA